MKNVSIFINKYYVKYVLSLTLCALIIFPIGHMIFNSSAYNKYSILFSLVLCLALPFVCFIFGYIYGNIFNSNNIPSRIYRYISWLIYIVIAKYLLNFTGYLDILSHFNIRPAQELVSCIPFMIFYNLLPRIPSYILLFSMIFSFMIGNRFAVNGFKDNQTVEANIRKASKLPMPTIGGPYIIIMCVIVLLGESAAPIYNSVAYSLKSEPVLEKISEEHDVDNNTLCKNIANIADNEFTYDKDPNSVRVDLSILKNDTYVEVFKNEDREPIFAGTVNKNDHTCFVVNNSLKIVTTKPEAVNVLCCEEDLKLEDASGTGIYQIIINYDTYKHEWNNKGNSIYAKRNK